MDSDPPLPLRSMIALEPLDIPAIETELFLRETLPPAPARVLEVGAGDGRLSARLARGGWTVTALDHSEPAVAAARARGVEAVCADFLEYRGGPFDVVAFTRSLHHMPLEAALERAEALLAPNGLLITEEFAYERADSATTAYLEREFEEFRARGYLTSSAASDRDGDPLERWLRHFRDEHQVHEGAALAKAVAWRFDLVRAERAPYLYRLLAAELDGQQNALQALIGIIDLEEQLISLGTIQPIGFRLVARRRRPD